MFIYKITNKINGKSYIGQTLSSIKKRWNRHCLKTNSKRMYISNAIKKYGKENFIIEEIDGANSISELNYKEWLLIYKNETLWPKGYNLREGGNNSKLSKKTIEKLKESAKTRKPRKNYKHTSETKKKIGKSNKGKGGKVLTKKQREERSLKFGGKPFDVYSKQLEYLGTWINQRQCARDLKLCSKKINSCLKKRQKTHKGYVFRYKG